MYIVYWFKLQYVVLLMYRAQALQGKAEDLRCRAAYYAALVKDIRNNLSPQRFRWTRKCGQLRHKAYMVGAASAALESRAYTFACKHKLKEFY